MPPYTSPFLPNESAALVSAPPWHFGGNVTEISYRADPNQVRQFLPPSFSLGEEPGVVAISFVDMTSLSTLEQAILNPESCSYRECLIKIQCACLGRQGWYAPVTWVDQAFSLLRGYTLGFGKKFGKITMSPHHPLNPLMRGRTQPLQRKVICEAPNEVRIAGVVNPSTPIADDWYGDWPIFLLRHFPSGRQGSADPVHEVAELEVVSAMKAEILSGDASVVIESVDDPGFDSLRPCGPVRGRIYQEGFTLKGIKVICDLRQK